MFAVQVRDINDSHIGWVDSRLVCLTEMTTLNSIEAARDRVTRYNYNRLIGGSYRKARVVKR